MISCTRRVVQFLFALVVILSSAVPVYSQSLSASCSLILNSPLVVSCPVASGFSLVRGSYVRLNPQNNAIQNATTSDAATQVIGIPLKVVQSSLIIQTSGLVTINFDGATTVGHTFTMSTTTAGYLHDTGVATCSSSTLGVINQTIGAAGQATAYWGSCQPSAGTGAVWGAITGTLSNQTDLQTSLTSKAASNATMTVNGVSCALGGSCSPAAWGGITGTLSGQTDLQTALNGKASTSATFNPQTSTYQALASDFAVPCTVIPVASGTFTITLVASGTQPTAGECMTVVNYGSGVVTIARSGQNINGGTTSLTVAAGSQASPSALTLTSNGTDYFSVPGAAASSILTCAGFPGSTTGTFLQTCEPSDLTGAYVCANASGCTVAADWNIAYPTPPTNGLVGWYKADCVTQPSCTNPANNANLSSWFNNADGLSITVAAGVAPVYKTAQVNGLGAFNFTNCRCSSSSGQGASGGSSGFALINTNTSVAGTIIGASSGGGIAWYITTAGVQKIDKAQISASGLGTTAITTATWHILDYTVPSGSGVPTFRVDRTTDPATSTATVTFSNTNIWLGDYGNDVAQLNALLTEVLLYSRVVSSQERTDIGNYLHLRCGCG